MVYGYDSDNPKYKYVNEKLALFILLRGTDLIDWKYPSDEEEVLFNEEDFKSDRCLAYLTAHDKLIVKPKIRESC